jgi:hypothetical protein
MIEIPLTQGKVALIDDEDAHLAQFKWCVAGTGAKAYAIRNPGSRNTCKRLLLHREVLGAPSGTEVDHVNGDGLDCRRSNLRLATNTQNHWNMGKRCDNTSGFKGAFFLRSNKKPQKVRRKPWLAQIKANGQTIYLGYFATAEDAARAYDKAAKELHGEFARLNFPEAP